MPYYSRYRRRGYSRYRRYRRRSGFRRRRYRSTGGSLSSRSRTRVKVVVEELCSVEIKAGQNASTVATSTPFANYRAFSASPTTSLKAGATSSALYRSYTQLFDQVKCDGVISKIAVTTPIGSSNSDFPALQIVTAYDRAGTIFEAMQTVPGANNPAPTTYKQILESSGSVLRTALNNSVAKCARTCWASDIQERTTFHDCTLNTVDSDNNNDNAYFNAVSNLNFFAPLLFVAFNLPTTAPTSPKNVEFILQQTYYFTFRNPKYGASAGTATQALVREDPLAVQSLDAEERVFTRDKSGYTPPTKKPRSVVSAVMESGLDDPDDVTDYLVDELEKRRDALDDPDYVGSPHGPLDPGAPSDLQQRLIRSRRVDTPNALATARRRRDFAAGRRTRLHDPTARRTTTVEDLNKEKTLDASLFTDTDPSDLDHDEEYLRTHPYQS